MFLAFAANVGGNLSELKQQWKTEPPFVFVDVSGTFESAEAIFNAFCGFIESVFNAVTEKLPALLEEAQTLPDEAEKVNERAQPELEELDMFQKAKAIANAGKNIA